MIAELFPFTSVNWLCAFIWAQRAPPFWKTQILKHIILIFLNINQAYLSEWNWKKLGLVILSSLISTVPCILFSLLPFLNHVPQMTMIASMLINWTCIHWWCRTMLVNYATTIRDNEIDYGDGKIHEGNKYALLCGQHRYSFKFLFVLWF